MKRILLTSLMLQGPITSIYLLRHKTNEKIDRKSMIGSKFFTTFLLSVSFGSPLESFKFSFSQSSTKDRPIRTSTMNIDFILFFYLSSFRYIFKTLLVGNREKWKFKWHFEWMENDVTLTSAVKMLTSCHLINKNQVLNNDPTLN